MTESDAWARLLASSNPISLDVPLLLRKLPDWSTGEKLIVEVLDEQRHRLGSAAVFRGGWYPGRKPGGISHYFPVLDRAFNGLELRGEDPLLRVQLLQAINAQQQLGKDRPYVVLLKLILGPEAAIPGGRVEQVYQCPLSGLLRSFVGVGADALRDPSSPDFVTGQAIHQGYARAARAYLSSSDESAAAAAYLRGVADIWVDLFPYLLLDRPSTGPGAATRRPRQLYRLPVEALSAVLGRCRQLYQDRQGSPRLLQERLFFSPARGISGRADRIVEDEAGRELWELKTRSSSWAVDRDPRTGITAPGGIQALAYHEILRTLDGISPRTFVEILDPNEIHAVTLQDHPVTRRADADVEQADDRYLDLVAQARNVAYLLESGLFSGYDREILAAASRQGARMAVLGGDYDLFGGSAPCGFCPAGQRDVCESGRGGSATHWPGLLRHVPERLFEYWAWLHQQLKQSERLERERLFHLVRTPVEVLETDEGICVAGLEIAGRDGRLVTLHRDRRVETRLREDDRVLVTPLGAQPGEVESIEATVRAIGTTSLTIEAREPLPPGATFRVDQLGFWERGDWQVEGLTDFLLRSMLEAGPRARRLEVEDLPTLSQVILGARSLTPLPAGPALTSQPVGPALTPRPPLPQAGEGEPAANVAAQFIAPDTLTAPSHPVPPLHRSGEGARGWGPSQKLNPGQQHALQAALTLGPGEMLLIQGPPGTGKTSLIAHLTRHLVLRDFWREADDIRPVLILANTHRACNEVVLKLHDRFPDLRPYLVRLGPVGAGMEPAVREHVITERLGVGSKLNDLDVAKDGPAALIGLVRQGNALLDEGLVFVGTLASATRPELRGRAFSTIVVDETGQATEPAVLQALRHAARGYQSRLILVGDHCQLPPVVPDDVTVPPLTPALVGIGLDQERGQRQSLFERLALREPDGVLTLAEQYRMCGPISDLVSATFYDGKLHPGTPKVENRHLGELLDQVGAELPTEPFARAAFNPSQPVVLIDTSQDASARDTVSHQARSETRDNPREAVLIADLVAGLLGPLAPTAREALAREIGIISPYRKQNNRIRQELGERLGPSAEQIRVDTVDRFQGGERDLILLSLVASNPTASIGSLHADWRRMNVAISRARRKVILVGNRRTFVTPSVPEEEAAKVRYRHLFDLIDAQVSNAVARILEPPR
jgi:hypothetical protein